MWNPFKKKDETTQPAPEATQPTPTPVSTPSASTPTSEGIKAPVSGKLITLDEVPDPVFAQRMMGEGFAVEPQGNIVSAPVAGEIMMIAPTCHAFAIRTPLGAEILVHIGLDTVNLKGEGFTVLAQEGQRVAAMDPVIEVDWDAVKDAVPSTVTPVVVTNGGDFELGSANLGAEFGEVVMELHAKN